MIKVSNLGKRYTLRHKLNQRGGYSRLSEELTEVLKWPARRLQRALINRNSNQPTDASKEEFWALRDVSFDVQQGEVVGIIGRNGAGKSTLLKLLSRITEPTTGRIELHGRVASLLEVGTGFHPELTGRENVFLNGAILGMTRSEIKRKFDEIVGFAEVEKFLDTPVKHFSSGMYVRLAFSVAAHLEPEILIVDEVLAVGDAEFQKRCLGKMQEVSKGGRTVLFVSHNMGAVKTLCSRVLLFSGGRLKSDGAVDEQINRYLTAKQGENGVASLPRRLSKHLTLKSLDLLRDLPESPESVCVRIEFDVNGNERIRELALLVYSKSGARVGILDLRGFKIEERLLEEGSIAIDARLSAIPLVEGEYDVGIYLVTNEFSGDVLAVSNLHVPHRSAKSRIAPYPAEVCGFADIQSSLTAVSITESTHH